MINETGGLDGLGQAELVASGQVSAAELIDAAIERIESVNSALNAVVYRDFDGARRRATGPPLPRGPFVGVPMLAKNSLAPRGMPFDRSCAFLKGTVATEEWPFNQAILDSGGVFLGETNSPELGLLGSTESKMHGATANPWNAALSPGGSSGGSTAAVASGMVPLATAGDGAGSIRIPSAHCGLVGLKVSRGRDVGADTEFLTNLGCVSRSVRDTAAFTAVTETPRPVDMEPIGFVPGPSSRRLNIAFSTRGHNGAEPEASVAAAVHDAALLLEDLGHEVTEQWLDAAGERYWHHFLTLWAVEPAVLVDQALKQSGREECFEPWALGLARLFREQRKPEAIESAYAYFRGYQRKVRRFLQEFDVYLTPVLSSPPIATGEQSSCVEFDELNDRLQRYVAYTPMANLAGIPSMSLPLYWNAENLPIGVLFNTGFGRERQLLELAYELEAARPWAHRWPGIRAV